MADTRALIYVSVSGGIADYQIIGDASLVRVIQVDWDNVEGESGMPADEQYSVNELRAVLEDEEVPEALKADLRISLERALRWEEDMERAPYSNA